MARIGLAVDSLQISSIDDKGANYIKALAAPHRPGSTRRRTSPRPPPTRPARWRARRVPVTRPSTPGRPPSRRPQYQAEIDQAQQKAAQAGPLAAAQAQQAVLAERALVAQKNAELREAELVAEVLKPAQADARAHTHPGPGAGRVHQAVRRGGAAEGRIALDQLVHPATAGDAPAAAEGCRRQPHRPQRRRGAQRRGRLVAGQGMALLDAVRRGTLHAPSPRPNPDSGEPSTELSRTQD